MSVARSLLVPLAGVIAAYVLLYPRVMVWVLAFRIIPLHITAALALGAWILTQFVMVLLPQSGPPMPIAWSRMASSGEKPRIAGRWQSTQPGKRGVFAVDELSLPRDQGPPGSSLDRGTLVVVTG